MAKRTTKRAKAPRPVTAWAVADGNGRLFGTINGDPPRLFPRRQDAARYAPARDDRPVRVVVSVAPPRKAKR